MRGQILFVWGAFLSLSSCQAVPPCASNCLSNSASVSGCGAFDVNCFCKSQDYINTLSCCIQTNCTRSEIVESIAEAQATCQNANVSDVIFPECSTINGTATAIPLSIKSASSTSSTTLAPSSTSSSTPSSTSLSNTVMPTPETSPAPVGPSSNVNIGGKSSISGGAIAGIVIGVVVAVAGIVAFIILLGRRNKEREGSKAFLPRREDTPVSPVQSTPPIGWYGQHKAQYHMAPHELPGKEVSEMASQNVQRQVTDGLVSATNERPS